MRLGLVTDIHSDDTALARALELFRLRDVDQVVTIGDTCDAFAPLDRLGPADRVVALLREAGAVGVWGNHDYSMCRDVSERVRLHAAPATLDFMATMEPALEIGGCRFSHKDASVDPDDIEQLWMYEDAERDLGARAAAGLAASPSRRQFVGHYHRWFAATEAGPLGWDGAEPLRLRRETRYFVVVAAVFNGNCGVLDTDLGTLEPLRCAAV